MKDEPVVTNDFQVTAEPEPAPKVIVKISDESLSDEPTPAVLPKAAIAQSEEQVEEQPQELPLESNVLEPLPAEPVTAEPQTPAAVESEPEDNNRGDVYGHADDYSWLKGRLHKVHVPGVEWKIRYLPIDEVDEWGGSMVLAPDIRLEEFNNLDVVYLKGKQLADRPSLYISGPLYRIESIHRPKLNEK